MYFLMDPNPTAHSALSTSGPQSRCELHGKGKRAPEEKTHPLHSLPLSHTSFHALILECKYEKLNFI